MALVTELRVTASLSDHSEATRPQPVEGEWRCSLCGHGDNLQAWAGANVSGQLLPDGSVVESYSDQHTLFEESIECTVHLSQSNPLAHLERWFNGQWTRLAECPWTGSNYRGALRCVNGKQTEVETRFAFPSTYGMCPGCGGSGVTWQPVAEASASGKER